MGSHPRTEGQRPRSRCDMTFSELKPWPKLLMGIGLTIAWAAIWFSDWYSLEHAESWFDYICFLLLTAGTAYIFVFHQIGEILYCLIAGTFEVLKK